MPIVISFPAIGGYFLFRKYKNNLLRKTVTGGGLALLLFYTMWSGMDRNRGILSSGIVVYYGTEYPAWKESFLKSLKMEHKIEQLWKGKNYTLWGMPFYNEEMRKTEFEECFNDLLV